MKNIKLNLTQEGYQLIETALLRLPGANGVHEFIEELRSQVKVQEQSVEIETVQTR